MKRSPGSSGSGEEGGEDGTTGVAQNEPLWRYPSRHDWPKISPPQRGKKSIYSWEQMSSSLRDQLPCFTASFLSADAEKKQRPRLEKICATNGLEFQQLSESLLRAFNHIYCSDMTDVCVRSFLMIDEYCAATRAWLILEGNWWWRIKLVDPTEESGHVLKL